MQYLRIQDISNKTKLCKSHIWEQVKLKKFPQPIALSPRVTVWDAYEVDKWMLEQKQKSRKSQEKANNAS